MSEWKEFRDKMLLDPEVRAEYDALEPEFTIIQAMIDARKITGLTQKQLSEKTGITQGDISKIERGEANPSLRTLKRLASGMNTKLKIEFVPSGSRRETSI
jgi:transcriptional regulator with XRE-family HTH domain